MTVDGQRILVLGGTGFIGVPLSHRLTLSGAVVTTASRSPDADVPMDARSAQAVSRLLTSTRYDAVVNLMGTGLAAATSDPRSLSEINAQLPVAVLAALLEQHPGTPFIHAASSTERTTDQEGDESEYSRTKHEGSQALRLLAEESTSPVTLLRIHNTYGPRQPVTRFVAGTIHALAEGRTVTLNFPDRVRDFVFIDDIVDSIVAVLADPYPGLSEIELGTGIGASLFEVAQTIVALLPPGAGNVVRHEPPLLDPHPRAVAANRGGDLGTCLTTLSEGLARTIGERA